MQGRYPPALQCGLRLPARMRPYFWHDVGCNVGAGLAQARYQLRMFTISDGIEINRYAGRRGPNAKFDHRPEQYATYPSKTLTA